MPMLSSAAWILHDLGLAASIGGSLFGKTALHPSLQHVHSAAERDRVADAAWRRFNWINLAAHAAVAVSWLTGRQMLSGREVSPTARSLTRTKDALVAASVATGVTSAVLGRALGKRVAQRRGPAQVSETGPGPEVGSEARTRTQALERAVDTVGTLNLIANVGTAAATSALAMEAAESLRFSRVSRQLP